MPVSWEWRNRLISENHHDLVSQNAPTSILVPMQGFLQKVLTWVGAWNIVRASQHFYLGFVLHKRDVNSIA